MFVNFSNHSSTTWDDRQYKAANYYGEIIDIPFPEVPPISGEEDVEKLATRYADKILKEISANDAVMVQGEFTLTYAVINLLRQSGIKVVSACSERDVVERIDEHGNTIRKSKFRFVRFREYK